MRETERLRQPALRSHHADGHGVGGKRAGGAACLTLLV